MSRGTKKYPREERGVSEVVGVILIIGLLVAVFASFYPLWRQTEIHRLEVEHMDAIKSSFSDLKSRIGDLGVGDSSSIDIKLGRDTIGFGPDSRRAADLSVSPTILNTITIHPSEDASVVENLPDNNFGGEGSLRVASMSDNNKRTFLKFPLENVPPGVTILKADLWLHCNDYRSPVKEVTDVRCYQVDDDGWSEGVLTWGNQPSMGSALDSLYIDEVGWVSLTVKDFVAEEAAGDRIVSLGLKMRGENYDGTERYVSFYSKEAGDKRPYLEVTYIAISLGEWMQTDWSEGATHPTLEVGTWDNQYNRYFKGENMNSGLPGELRLENASPTAYKPSGWLESSIYDAGGIADWGKIAWIASTPSGVDVSYLPAQNETVYEGGTISFDNAKVDDGNYENIYENDYGNVVFQSISVGKRSTDGFTVTVNKPTGTVEGDLLIAFIAKDDDDAITGVPTGWTLIVGQAAQYQARFNCYYKIATASEPDSYTWRGDREQYVGVILRYTGHDPTNPINAYASASSSTANNSPVAPSVTTTVDGCLIIQAFGADDDDTPYTVPSPLTQRWNEISNTGNGTCGTAGGEWVQTSAGNTGTATFTMNAPEEWAAITIAIAPAVAYRMDVQHNITGIPAADNYELQIKYYITGDSENFIVYLENRLNPGEWNNIDNLDNHDATLASPALFTYDLTGTDYISGGEVRVRYVQPDNDPTRTSLMVDYCRVKTEALRLTGITVLTRTGGTENAYDGTWSGWQVCTNGSDVHSPENRYIQYRVKLWTESDKRTPVFEEITINYLKGGAGASAYGAVELRATNEFYPSQTYVYEGGGVVLIQDGVDLMASDPAMVAASDAGGGLIRVDVSFLVIKNRKASIASTGTVTVRASCEGSRQVVAPVEGPNRENVVITVSSAYSKAWGGYLQKLRDELDAKGYNPILSPDGMTLTILGRPGKDIYYYERVKEIEVILT
jgi:hypothetical protein